MKHSRRISSAMRRLENLTAVQAIRSGLIHMIPVLTIGAFALILTTFPPDAYQRFIRSLAGGFFLDLLQSVYSATFGVMSLYMTFFISRAYIQLKAEADISGTGAAVSSMLCFFILAGAYLPDFGTESMGAKSMFLAILTGLGASALYRRLSLAQLRRLRTQLFSQGADRQFNRTLSTLFPIAVTALCFGLLNAGIVHIFRADSFRSLLAELAGSLFSRGDSSFFKGFCFVLLSSVLWFFGIHGSDALEEVMQRCFDPGLAANQAAQAAGALPREVLTRQFFDCFVLMGGCGAAICLLLCILIFSRNRARRGLGFAAAFPMFFNINEMMVFGLPIIYNPVMLIPFLAAPLVCYTTSYFALSLGLVPMITREVAWTTPIFMGGYIATGSVAGGMLQLINAALGMLIYLPFLRQLDREDEENARRSFARYVDFFREHEDQLAGEKLIERSGTYGDFSRSLCAELRHGLEEHLILAYQPQYGYDGRCMGAEALMRWDHPVHGRLYPPLVVRLAEEGGFLPELEEAVLLRAIRDLPRVRERFGPGVKLSVNVTGATVVTPRYLQFCRELNERDPFRGKNLCLEVTEQAALTFNAETHEAFQTLRDMGLLLAIDDFSMGHTSLHYLKDNMFTLIKLDGSLVKGLFSHQNCEEIISSIVRLAGSLNMSVLAEYVETEEQREALHSLGCDQYQGYLYSPAVFLEDRAG